MRIAVARRASYPQSCAGTRLSLRPASSPARGAVAPGIAEALFATAIGLVAAIPAVIAYNQFTVALGRSSDRITPAIAGLARSLARRGVEANQ